MMRHENPDRFVYRDDVQATYDRLTGSTIVGLPDVKPEAPLLIDISVTNRCSGGCSFCYQDARPDGQDAPYEAVLEQLARIHPAPFQVALGGGEPANWPDLFRFIGGLGSMGIDATITAGPGINSDGLWHLGMLTQDETLKAVGVSLGDDEQLFFRTADECNGKAVAH
ncbi:MAG: radical SAM protein, partial [bacterium]